MTVEGSTDKFIFILFFFSFLLLLFVFDGRNEPRTHNNTHTKQKTYISKKDKPVPLCVAIFLRMRYNPPPFYLYPGSVLCSGCAHNSPYFVVTFFFECKQKKKNLLTDAASELHRLYHHSLNEYKNKKKQKQQEHPEHRWPRGPFFLSCSGGVFFFCFFFVRFFLSNGRVLLLHSQFAYLFLFQPPIVVVVPMSMCTT